MSDAEGDDTPPKKGKKKGKKKKKKKKKGKKQTQRFVVDWSEPVQDGIMAQQWIFCIKQVPRSVLHL